MLFEDSEESPDVPGLALLRGHIRKFKPEAGIKIPHMGWNSLKLQNNGRLFQNIQEDPYVYFVHSYYLKADDPGIVTACTQYGSTIADVSIQYGNLFGCQFHPEKSSRTGLAILENFIQL